MTKEMSMLTVHTNAPKRNLEPDFNSEDTMVQEMMRENRMDLGDVFLFDFDAGNKFPSATKLTGKFNTLKEMLLKPAEYKLVRSKKKLIKAFMKVKHQDYLELFPSDSGVIWMTFDYDKITTGNNRDRGKHLFLWDEENELRDLDTSTHTFTSIRLNDDFKKINYNFDDEFHVNIKDYRVKETVCIDVVYIGSVSTPSGNMYYPLISAQYHDGVKEHYLFTALNVETEVRVCEIITIMDNLLLLKLDNQIRCYTCLAFDGPKGMSIYVDNSKYFMPDSKTQGMILSCKLKYIGETQNNKETRDMWKWESGTELNQSGFKKSTHVEEKVKIRWYLCIIVCDYVDAQGSSKKVVFTGYLINSFIPYINIITGIRLQEVNDIGFPSNAIWEWDYKIEQHILSVPLNLRKETYHYTEKYEHETLEADFDLGQMKFKLTFVADGQTIPIEKKYNMFTFNGILRGFGELEERWDDFEDLEEMVNNAMLCAKEHDKGEATTQWIARLKKYEAAIEVMKKKLKDVQNQNKYIAPHARREVLEKLGINPYNLVYADNRGGLDAVNILALSDMTDEELNQINNENSQPFIVSDEHINFNGILFNLTPIEQPFDDSSFFTNWEKIIYTHLEELRKRSQYHLIWRETLAFGLAVQILMNRYKYTDENTHELVRIPMSQSLIQATNQDFNEEFFQSVLRIPMSTFVSAMKNYCLVLRMLQLQGVHSETFSDEEEGYILLMNLIREITEMHSNGTQGGEKTLDPGKFIRICKDEAFQELITEIFEYVKDTLNKKKEFLSEPLIIEKRFRRIGFIL